ncbi:MAG: GNAT family N-acetyltransferase [bacterium]|nr:GNAT family N-acetyltransferase [bacterium]
MFAESCGEVLRFKENERKKWEEFVETSENGTIFHLRKFIDYHPKGKFVDHSLIFSKKGNPIALFPAVIKGDKLISHPGASYGGFVMKEGIGIRESSQIVETLLNYSKKQGIKRIEITQTPLIYYKLPCNYIDFALMKQGFKYKKRELTAVVTIEHENTIISTFKPEARTAVRKAEKLEVKVHESTDFVTFYKILKKNLSMRHGVTPTHTVSELKLLHSIFTKRIKLFSAFIGQKMIAGIVIFIANQRVMLAFYISHIEDCQQYRPVNILIYKLLEWGKTNKYKYLDLGTFTLNMEPDWGLGKFKENFRARGIFRDTFYINL